jgi:NodT family efflux transporter outer membrane factor (OMF) lipoprotein
MKRATFTAVVATATLLGGCMVGPDFERPAGPSAERYTAQPPALAAGDAASQKVLPGSSPSRDWWRAFGSADLDGIVDAALAHNRTLAAAAASLEQAQELARAQAGALAPQVDATGGVGRQKYGAQFLGDSPKPPPFSYLAVGATVSYALDYTGGIARSVEARYAEADRERELLDAARLSVSGNAVLQALRVASLRAQIAALDTILGEDRENLDLVQQAFDAGSVSRLDIVSAQSQLASDATLLPPLRQDLAVARHALALLVGKPPAELAAPAFDLAALTLPAELPLTLPSELAHRRPDILAAEAELHAATAAVGVATANLYPQITLSASGGLQATDFSHLFDRASNVFGLAGALVAPILDGGTLRAEQRAAVAAMHASAARYEETVLAAFGQVADTLEALQHDAEALDAQARAESAARDSLDLTRRSYNEGNVGVLQVLDAQRLFQQARLGYVRAEAQRFADTAELYLALGGAGPQDVAPTAANSTPVAVAPAR